MTSTVVACATGAVRAGISIVRISGPLAKKIGEKVCQQSIGAPNRTVFRSIFDNQGQLIDKGLVVFFQGPASFTGEDVLELQTHGSPFIVEQVITSCLSHGAEYARPGEFSERAFLNGKIDLVQAESIADLINAQSAAQASAALASLEGALSSEVSRLQEKLVKIRTQIEASIDFSDQSVDTQATAQLSEALQDLGRATEALISKVKRAIHNQCGLRVAMVGAPNVGKSSLMNQLTQQESAIVTDIPGTTRDVIKAQIAFQGHALEIMDTAGIRETLDPIETIGVSKTYEALQVADIVWVLADVSSLSKNTRKDIEATLGEHRKKSIIVGNKCDLAPSLTLPDWLDCTISAKSGEGIESLLAMTMKRKSMSITSAFSARRRHLKALEDFSGHLQQGLASMSTHIDAAAEDLRCAQKCLSVMTGAFHNEDLLDQIFGTFCLGK
tara:strand:- start:972 stop:2297 length:1326 start_codon:yes stop_codon:yes gene_type:complete